jgi:hypothetical protein
LVIKSTGQLRRPVGILAAGALIIVVQVAYQECAERGGGGHVLST